jgi:DNA-binding response OmpR family regulator
MAKILLIEDDRDYRAILTQTIQLDGHTVLEAGDGDQGIEMFVQHRPDLVITDLILPCQDGVGVILTLRQKDPQVKLIAISGGGNIDGVDYLQMTTDLGVQATFEKPFSGRELLKKIKELV